MTLFHESLPTHLSNDVYIRGLGSEAIELALFDAQPELPFAASDGCITPEDELSMFEQEESLFDTKEKR